MPRFFEKFRGNALKQNLIWQECDTLFPFKCDQCKRELQGKRFLASSLVNHSHQAVACLCPDCREGKDVNRVKQPKLSERRKTLD